MFYFRINRIFISDNKENPKFLIFGPDKAQVKLMSFVSTEDSNLPDLSDYTNTLDVNKQKEIINSAIETVVSSRILTTIDNVEDNHVMYFGKTGYVLHKSNKIPEDFDWQFLAIESDQNIRTNAELISDIMNAPSFDGFTSDLIKALSVATNPALTASINIAKYAIKVSTDIAKKNKDDLIGILYTSLNRRQHYPNGERKKDRVRDLTNNMFIDYSIFGYDE